MRFSLVWLLIFLSCVVMTTLMALGIPNKIEARRVVEEGELVDVEIVRWSKALFDRRQSYFVHFIYLGQKHSTQIGSDYYQRNELVKSIKLLHLPEYPNLFFTSEHNEEGQLTSAYLLVLMFGSLSVYSFIKLVKKE